MIDSAGTENKYRNHEPVPTDEMIEKAYERLAAARRAISQSSPMASALDDILRMIPTSAIDTLAVTFLPDGFVAQLYNPEFVLSCQTTEDLVFIRTHEVYHVFLGHLWGPLTTKDDIRVMAEETVINDRVSRMYAPKTHPRNWKMPSVVGEDGTAREIGVHPHKVYTKYRKDLRDAGMDPVEYETFVSTDIRCEAELRRMKTPPTPKGRSQCMAGPACSGSHTQGDKGNPGSHPHQDPGTLKESVEGATEKVMKQAINSKASTNRAKDELLDVMDMTADSDVATEMFGNIGVGALRGETQEQKRVAFWQQYLQHNIHERVRDGETVVFNEALVAFPGPPRVASIGEETYKQGVIAVDASGSMRYEVLEYIAELLGEEEDLKFDFLAFDAEVWPFNLGEPIRGGGGTNFGIIDDYIHETFDTHPDFVIVVTDGYAPAITPREPDRWVWVITEGGSTWPEDHDVPMDTVVIDDAELAAAAHC